MTYRLPAVRIVVLLGMGIGLAETFPVPFLYAFYVSLAFLVLVLLLLPFRAKLLFSFVLQFLFLLVGYTLHVGNEETTVSRRLLPLQKDEAIRVYGTIHTTPRYRERSVRFLVAVDSLEHTGWFGGNPQTLLISCRTKNTDSLRLKRAASVIIDGNIQEFPTRRNPGEFDYGRYLELQDIDGIVSAETVVVLDRQAEKTLWMFVCRIQEYFYSIFDSLHSRRTAGFLKSLILGNRDELAEDIKDSFVTTGTIHILAVSGTHVGVVALIFYVLFTLLRLPSRGVFCASIVGLLLYMVVTGMSPSVVRATIMAVIILLGKCLERPANIYNSLAVAALLLLIADTRNLFSIGAQLSFAAVISIVFFYPRFTAVLAKWNPQSRIIEWLKGVYKLFAVSLAAQIGTLPFTAYYFGRISLVAFLANLVVVPLAGLLIILGFVELLIAPLSMTIAGCYGAVTDVVVGILFTIVEGGARVPFASVSLLQLAPVELVLYFLVAAGITMPRKTLKYTFLAFLLYFNWNVYSSLLSEQQHKVTAVFYDVGQGDACLLQLPADRFILIDAGPRIGASDAGKRVLVPSFRQNNITHLQYLVITHPHDDHYGGMMSVVSAVTLDTLVLPQMKEYPENFGKLVAEIQQKGVAVKYVARGDQLYPHPLVRVYILHPDRDRRREKNLNNSSVVVKLVYRKESALFMGDAEREVEQALCRRYGDFLKASLLKVGHHGSTTSSGKDFVESVQPHFGVISVGEKNKFGHPSPAVLELYKERNVAIYRTDIDRAVLFENTGDEWKLKPWQQ